MLKMRVLIACEESQEVCKAFRELGHEAFSCDVLPCSGGHPEWHIQDDVLNHLDDGWDLMIAHPPCTYLSYAGTRVWNREGRVWDRLKALDFFAKLWTCKIPLICIENPRGCSSPTISKYSQIIQPYFFGDEESKTTWLWLKGLPLLKPTNIVKPKVHRIAPNGKKVYFEESITCKDRAKLRSKTFPGIAKAMANQWSGYLTKLNTRANSSQP
jgi:hypothetical protein